MPCGWEKKLNNMHCTSDLAPRLTLHMLYAFIVLYYTVLKLDCLQCFEAVGWAAGRASGLQKTY